MVSNPNPNDARNRERGLSRVARLGDGWMSTTLTPELLGEYLSDIRRYADEAGRQLPDDFDVVAFHSVMIDDDRDVAFAEAKRFLDDYYFLDHSEAMVRRWCSYGPPAAGGRGHPALHRRRRHHCPSAHLQRRSDGRSTSESQRKCCRRSSDCSASCSISTLRSDERGILMVNFGLTLSNRGVVTGASTLDDMIALAQRADADERWESIWVGDSILAKPRLDALGLMSALAVVTDRVRIGPACFASTPLRDALLLAYQYASLDFMSNGRARFLPPAWARRRRAAATCCTSSTRSAWRRSRG